MNESLQSEQNPKYSFLDLLNNCSVRIPVIQRDYVQGRNTVEQIRNSFLDSIANAVKSVLEARAAQPLSLDFIYGTIVDGFLEPIDGQQRLTTLFLLHWYFAAKEHRVDALSLLNKFTYTTRTSSTSFCQELCNDIERFSKKAEFEGSLSAAIQDSYWFMPIWKDDPTVSAMLVMLDAIDKHPVLGTISDVYPLFEQNPPVVFQFLPIENFGKGEELYIKMNSRGKRLTDYENFKALFGKQLHEDSNLSKSYWENIDGKWSHDFWEFTSKRYIAKKTPVENYCYRVDNTILRYLWLQLEMIWCMDTQSKSQETSSPFYTGSIVRFNFELVRGCLSNTPYIAGIKTERLLLASLELFAALLYQVKELIGNESNAITLWDTDSLVDTFLPIETLEKGVLVADAKSMTYLPKILVFSSIVWCVKNGKAPDNDDDRSRLRGYLRVIRNALTRIRSVKSTREGEYTPSLRFENIGNIVKFITEHLFSDVSRTAYKVLETIDDKIISSNFSQMSEEKRKALYIAKNPSVLQSYHETEDFAFFRGTLSQVIDSQGELALPQHLLYEIFDSSSSENWLLLTRAILAASEGFYLHVTYERVRFGGRTENQWLVGLTYSDEQTKLAFSQFADSYKSLRAKHQNYEQTLDAIIKDYLSNPSPWMTANGEEDWRYYFVKYPQSLQSYYFSDSIMRNPLNENLEDQPIFIWNDSAPFTCRTLLNGVRRTRPHTNTFAWIAAQDSRISNYYDASASWQSGNDNCNSFFYINNRKTEISCVAEGFLLDGKLISADYSYDRIEKLINEIQNY